MSIELPRTFHGADKAAVDQQKKFRFIMGADLVALVAGSFFAAIVVPLIGDSQLLRFIPFLILMAGLALFLIGLTRHYERGWFESRAIAESTRELAWRYACAAEPFQRVVNTDDADRKFQDALRRAQQRHGHGTQTLGAFIEANAEISQSMRELRKAPWNKRKEVFIKDRIENQLEWYQRTAKRKGAANSFFTLIFVALQTGGIAAAALWAAFPGISVSFTAVFVSGAGAVMAWSRLSRYRYLKHAYTETANELALGRDEALRLSSEEDFVRLVDHIERVISYEHSKWLVR